MLYICKDEGEFPGPNLTPDNDIFRQVAAVYVDNHPTMKNTTKCYRLGKTYIKKWVFWWSDH